MTTAILDSLQQLGYDVSDSIVSRRNEGRMSELARYGVRTTIDNRSVESGSDTVVLAVKPQDMRDVISGLDGTDGLYVSIAAGYSLTHLEDRLDRVVRVMPDIGLAYGSGNVFYSLGSRATVDDERQVRAIFAKGALIKRVDESLLGVATALASMPGVVAYIAGQFSSVLTENGFSHVADEGFTNTYRTAAKLASVDSWGAVVKKVCSKGGTTQAAIEKGTEQDLERILRDMIEAALQRCKLLDE